MTVKTNRSTSSPCASTSVISEHEIEHPIDRDQHVISSGRLFEEHKNFIAKQKGQKLPPAVKQKEANEIKSHQEALVDFQGAAFQLSQTEMRLKVIQERLVAIHQEKESVYVEIIKSDNLMHQIQLGLKYARSAPKESLPHRVGEAMFLEKLPLSEETQKENLFTFSRLDDEEEALKKENATLLASLGGIKKYYEDTAEKLAHQEQIFRNQHPQAGCLKPV